MLLLDPRIMAKVVRVTINAYVLLIFIMLFERI